MSNTAVVYKSKYGSTQKYAKWISQDADAVLLRAQDVKAETLLPYDTVVYCGGLYAGGILGFSLIKKNMDQLSAKRLIVVAVGATLKTEDAAAEVKRRNIPPAMLDKVSFFLLRGGLNYQKMRWTDRFLMRLQVMRIKSMKPEELDDDSKGVLGTYGKVVDFTNKRSIDPVIRAIRGHVTQA